MKFKGGHPDHIETMVLKSSKSKNFEFEKIASIFWHRSVFCHFAIVTKTVKSFSNEEEIITGGIFVQRYFST